MTFTQLTTRLKNFLRGWLLVLGLKEGLLECAAVCVKSEVILFLIEEVRGIGRAADRLKIGKGILKSEPDIAKKKNYHYYQKSNPKSNYCTICNMNLYDRRYTE